ncbi:MAG: FkbM family methyltransferase [Mucilaginibacter sp.]
MKLTGRIIFKLFSYRPTYSQCGEDVIIGHLLRMFKKDKISYLDIGTNHPKIFNNTYLFYINGGTGICVEPNPVLCKKIASQRRRDTCLNVGISTLTSASMDFYRMDVDTLSTFSKGDAEKLQNSGNYKIMDTIKVPVININELMRNHFETAPDLVSIDVEDWNEDIVKSIDFTIRPLIFCVETLAFGNTSLGKKIDSIKQHFVDNGYIIYADTFINTIFIDKKMSNDI